MITSTYCLDVWHGDHTFAIGRCITPHWCCYAVTPVIWHLYFVSHRLLNGSPSITELCTSVTSQFPEKVLAELAFPTCTKLLINQNLLVHLTFTMLRWPCHAICLYSCVKRKLRIKTLGFSGFQYNATLQAPVESSPFFYESYFVFFRAR